MCPEEVCLFPDDLEPHVSFPRSYLVELRKIDAPELSECYGPIDHGDGLRSADDQASNEPWMSCSRGSGSPAGVHPDRRCGSEMHLASFAAGFPLTKLPG